MSQSILLIYTGGTIGMKQDPETPASQTLQLRTYYRGEVPELKNSVTGLSLTPLIRSSTRRT